MYESLTGFQVKVFESCYGPHYGTVGIVGPSTEIISSLQSRENYSVILIDNEPRIVPEAELHHSAFRNQLQIFLVSESKAMRRYILENLWTSQWWNHMATFLIIEKPTSSDQNCSKAVDILYDAWKLNLLNAKFICLRESKVPMIYSYNPYTDQAPIHSQQKITYIIEEHLWTLSVRSYHQDKHQICEYLDFDQTRDLGGYEIKIGMIFEPGNWFNDIHKEVFRALNSTTTFTYVSSLDELFDLLLNSSIDIILEELFTDIYIANSVTSPYLRRELAFVTRHRGNLPQIEKLLRVIDRFSRYGVVIVCLVTFIFFKFFLRQPVTSAILTIVRLICNAAIPDPPNIVATRIYLTGLFIFVMTLQGIYQGKLASLLTTSVALPNVETLDDLENLNYTMYGRSMLISMSKLSNYSGPIVMVEDSCVEYVLRDDSAACAMERHELFNVAYMNNLYLSDRFGVTDLKFIVRKDWPLQGRFELILLRLFESNINERIYWENSKLILRKWKFYEKEKENQGPTVIALKDLAFAFAFLGIGLAGATVVFFIERWKGRE